MCYTLFKYGHHQNFINQFYLNGKISLIVIISIQVFTKGDLEVKKKKVT